MFGKCLEQCLAAMEPYKRVSQKIKANEGFRDTGVDSGGAPAREETGFQNWVFAELESSQLPIKVPFLGIRSAWDVVKEKNAFPETTGVRHLEKERPRDVHAALQRTRQ